jgi:TM2 domain-containing membrane protein YozV
MNQTSSGNDFFSGLAFFVIACIYVAAIVLFFLGPAKSAEKYVNSLADGIADENDRALFLSLYKQKGGKSVLAAWLLTGFLTPTIAYIYIGEYVKAVISFITGEGFLIWWAVSIYTMPFETMAKNKQCANDALTQLRLMRPNLSTTLVAS